MEYSDAINMVEEMRARFDAGFSSSDKRQIEELYYEVSGKKFTPTNCNDCYRDAFISIYNYLKTNKKMKEKCSYSLLGGVIIQDFENSKIYTNDNLTDEVAEEYLKRFPAQIEMFGEHPDDWEERIKDVEKEETQTPIDKEDAEKEKVSTDKATVEDKGTVETEVMDKKVEATNAEDSKTEAAIDKVVNEDKLKKELIEELVDRLEDGSTVKQLQDDYKDYVVQGVKITQENLDKYLEEAEDIVVELQKK
jgi:hypothetical protein